MRPMNPGPPQSGDGDPRPTLPTATNAGSPRIAGMHESVEPRYKRRRRQFDPLVKVSRGNLTIVVESSFEQLSEDDRAALDRMLPAGNDLKEQVNVHFDSLREHVSNVATKEEVLTGLDKVTHVNFIE